MILLKKDEATKKAEHQLKYSAKCLYFDSELFCIINMDIADCQSIN